MFPGSMPSVANRSWTSGILRILSTSACRRSTMAGGVPAGAKIACHETTSKPGTPASCMVGTSGRLGTRFAVDTASARTRPLAMCGAATTVVSNISELVAITSWIAGPLPL
jgi:hypothetical protein